MELSKLHGKPLPINGDLRLLFRADDLSDAEKQILKCYLETTRTIAGCQAIRRRIGHCLFGFRCVSGEVIFVTVSPSRRYSHMLLRMSRIRRNDPMANATLRKERVHTSSRFAHAGPSTPGLFTSDAKTRSFGSSKDDIDLYYLFTEYNDMSDSEKEQAKSAVERISVELQLPTGKPRLAWVAEDPLASVHHYLTHMRVLLHLAFGVRMCFACPHCNSDTYPKHTRKSHIPANIFMAITPSS